ncbi:hypothetical protein PBY51_005494 [Eleginops maclovinus]|uniref:Uncharacterized protein n=1 Tax=Eleginops maclovinus TaxID=56733 RepID=A0AAN7X5N3_ELEMC|nr:hypothetical protein PBY51_005494 [Eleginops maclovinus]
MLACLSFHPPPPPLSHSPQLLPLSSLSLPQQGSSIAFHPHPSVQIPNLHSSAGGTGSVRASNNSPPCQNIHPTMPLISLPACSALPHPGTLVLVSAGL